VTRFSLSKVALGGVLFVSVAALSTSMTLTPASHNCGRIVVGATSPYQRFRLTGTPPVLQSSCLGLYTATTTWSLKPW